MGRLREKGVPYAAVCRLFKRMLRALEQEEKLLKRAEKEKCGEREQVNFVRTLYAVEKCRQRREEKGEDQPTRTPYATEKCRVRH